MLTQEQIDQAVKDAVPNVLKGLRKEIEERAMREASDLAMSAVRTEVSAWCSTNLVPAIREQLVASKDGIVAIAPKLATEIVDALTTRLAAELQKKLEQSWERKKIFEALFT